MVRMIANIPPNLYKRIKELIDAGEYEDFEQFIESACLNQVVLSKNSDTKKEQNLVKTEEVSDIKHDLKAYQTTFIPCIKDQKVSKKPERKTRSGKSKKTPPESIQIKDYDIQRALDIFRKPVSNDLPEFLPQMEEYTKEWPWGQTNRYLPLKMVVRAVANVSQNSKWPRLNEISNALLEPSSVLGSALLQADRSAGRKREQSLATALPRLEKEDSAKRFVNTFMGSITPTGIFYPGGAFYYGFISRIENDIIGLTKSGVEFSQLENLILDGDPNSANETLSDAERSWLHKYAMSLPGEGGAFKIAIDALGKDKVSPDEFGKRVAEMLNLTDDGGFRIRFNGVVSRIIEIKLLKRSWQGTKAFYEQ